MYKNKPTPAEMLHIIEAEKEIKSDSFRYDFKFEKLSNYDETIVEINFRIPFRKLHLLYLIPYQILKSYWSVVTRRTDEIVMKDFNSLINTEKEHLEEVNKFFPILKIDENMEFPHLLKEGD